MALLAFALYLPTLRFGLVIWDDPVNITDNPYVKPFSFAKLKYLWLHPYGDLYVPLVYTTFALEILASGARAWLFHFNNALLHAASSALVFAIVRRYVPSLAAAALGALVFALHPIQVEAVAWVTGRKDVLSGCLALLAVWQYQRWRGGAGRLAYAAALLSFVLSLLAKPAAVAVPFILAGMDLFGEKKSLRQSALALAPWLALAALWSVLTSRAQPVTRPVELWLRPFVAGDAILFYLRKILWPTGLAPVYGRMPWWLTRMPAWWLGFLACLGACAWLWKVRGMPLLCASIFVAGLLPVLGLKQFRYQNYSTVADRYVYVSMLGVSLALAAGASKLLESRKAGLACTRRALPAGAVIVFLTLGALSVRQQLFWKDSQSVTDRCLEIGPQNSAAHSNKALLYVDQGRLDDAIAEYKKALQSLDHADIYNNLGFALSQKGDYAGAIDAYHNALARQPDMVSSHDGLARTYMAMSQLAKAVPEFEAALATEPDRHASRINLGLALAQLGRHEEALPHYQMALKAQPEAQVYAFLSDSLLQLGRTGEAQAALQKAVQLDPNHPEVRAMLRKLSPSPAR